MILFTCLIGLKWVGGRGVTMGRRSGEGWWWGQGVRGIVEERGESIGGAGLTGGKKHSSDYPPLSFHGAPCEQSNEVQITAQDC